MLQSLLRLRGHGVAQARRRALPCSRIYPGEMPRVRCYSPCKQCVVGGGVHHPSDPCVKGVGGVIKNTPLMAAAVVETVLANKTYSFPSCWENLLLVH